MIVYRSVRTGRLYPIEFIEDWGRTAESDGYGPTPRCTQLVPNERAKKARGRDGEPVTPLQVCGGDLMPADVPLEDIITAGGMEVLHAISPAMRTGRPRHVGKEHPLNSSREAFAREAASLTKSRTERVASALSGREMTFEALLRRSV
jgi:hypothetical protein